MNNNATKQQTHTIVLVGHCGPDSSFLRMAASGAAPGSIVGMADSEAELDAAVEKGVDLLLFNRVMEFGFDERDGVALLARTRQKHPELTAMMISNYPEAQQAAEAVGAVPGFGKRDVGSDKSRQRIRQALGLE
jgi:DNA-binding NarL/FixJ family response regulator